MLGYGQFEGTWRDGALLAWDCIRGKAAPGIPTANIHVMDIPFMEQVTGRPPGAFARDVEGVYLDFQRHVGTCFIGQYIPDNPLTMTDHGLSESAERGAATGADRIVLDGIQIDSPEAVVEHLESVVFPRREAETASFDPEDHKRTAGMVAAECAVQKRFGPSILKGPYGWPFQSFPYFHYTTYGYVNYFSAYALYPEVMERDFSSQADLARLRNRAAARAIIEGGLPRQLRLDHDMADSRGTLTDIRSLDRIWFPHFARSVEPFLEAGIRLLWHCDGNLMAMVPRLIEAGVSGFQGFQYEDGMDYEAICRMTDREGRPLHIIAGVSVTRTLPFGLPADVRDELNWLVRCGPETGLFLGASSTIAPRTPHANILALIEGLRYYRERRRSGAS
jgi:hypothetical protein